MDFSRFNINIFLTEAFFYVTAFFTAIASTLEINKILAAQAEIARRAAALPPGAPLVLPANLANMQNFNAPELITLGQFMIAFLFATVFFIVLIKTKYGAGLLRFIFLVAVFSGSQIIFRIWVSRELSIILALAVVAARLLFPVVIMHNVAIITAITGIAVNLGMNMKPSEAILILIAISVYDFIAVYVTRHMVSIFKSTISLGTVFAMIVPQNFRDMIKTVSEVGEAKSAEQDKNTKSAYVYLGGGDLAFPLIMAVVSLKVGIYSAAWVSLGALAGLLALNIIFVMQKERRPMAAMPPLAIFSILGFLASLVK